MFERLFGTKKELTQDEAERLIGKVVGKEFKIGVNSPAMNMAFKSAREENERLNLGLTNNHLLNITKAAAQSASGAVENFLYGSAEQTNQNIEMEIERLREGLTSEERRS